MHRPLGLPFWRGRMDYAIIAADFLRGLRDEKAHMARVEGDMKKDNEDYR